MVDQWVDPLAALWVVRLVYQWAVLSVDLWADQWAAPSVFLLVYQLAALSVAQSANALGLEVNVVEHKDLSRGHEDGGLIFWDYRKFGDG